MSLASTKGKHLELEVAGILRKKLGARVTRDKQSGAGVSKQDIRDYYSDLPFSIECKDQETVQIKSWMRQAIDATSFHQVPTLVFRMDEEIIAAVRFSDLVDLAVEIADLRAELDDLRQPVVATHGNVPALVIRDVVKAVTKKKAVDAVRTDANG